MGFTTSCYIKKNNDDIIKALIRLGYVEYETRDSEPSYIFCNNGWLFQQSVPSKAVSGIVVDCGENDELFLAVAAKRDDTSANQYWVFDHDFLPHYKKGDFTIGYFHRCSCYCHVATIEELIEHFK